MIEITGITKRYGTLKAVDSLSLSIGAGEVFGFIGPNGSGKSTTMKVVAGLLIPDEGQARVDGLDVRTHGDEIRRRIGYMPDFLGYYDDLSVDEYLQFFASAYGLPRAKRRSVVDGVLELTDLGFKRDAMVNGLSRGMQQRLGVARVLVHDPKVLLLDEPASGLDPRARIEMKQLVRRLGEMGKTLMISSHILTELGEMCTSIGIIERGRLLFAGSMQEAFTRTRALGDAGERVLVKLEEGSAEAGVVSAALEKDARVRRVEAGPEEGTLVVELPPGVGSHHGLIEALIGAGARIGSFTPQGIRLEDAFLKLTTGALQ